MSITITDTQTVAHKPRRTRKTHAKVRTGCVTCKIRRKKCDETKPSCLRCVNTGRKCDGYESQVSNETSPSFSLPTPVHTPTYVLSDEARYDEVVSIHSSLNSSKPCQDFGLPLMPIYNIPRSVTFASDVDFHCFDYFRFKTGPQIQSYFESSLWTTEVLRAALCHPVVLKAATAVGAVHQRFNYGISREAFEYCAISDRLHREAVESFIAFQRDKDFTEGFHEVSVITSMLFALFEGFQGNFDRAVQHISFGLRTFWQRPSSVTYSESLHYDDKLKMSFFFDLYQNFYDRAMQLFDTPPNCLAYDPSQTLPPVPHCFNSLEEARDVIFTEVRWILHSPVRLWRDAQECRKARNHYVSRNLHWSVALAELKQLQPGRTDEEKQAGRLLRCLNDMTHLLLYLIFFINLDKSSVPFVKASVLAKFLSDVNAESDLSIALDSSIDLDSPPPDFTTFNDDDGSEADDALLLTSPLLWNQITDRLDLRTRLHRIRMLADTITDTTSPFAYTTHSLSMDSGIGPPLARMPTPTSSSKTRHMIMNVVKNDRPAVLSPSAAADCPQTNADTTVDNKDLTDQKVWQLLGGYNFVELFASMEEHAVLMAARDLIPAHLAPKWVDLRCFLDERRLLVRYCRPDGTGGSVKGLVWVQEWISF